MQVYKIRRKSDGLFASTKTYNSWAKVGHVFNHMSHLISSVKAKMHDYRTGRRTETEQVRVEGPFYMDTPFSDLEIVTYSLTETGTQELGQHEKIRQ